jgi:hypothetical protein
MTTLVTALNAVTATTTSNAINIEGAKKVVCRFVRTNHSSGKTVFTVTASLDGTTYHAYNLLVDNVANAISEGITRVASYDTGTANADKIYALDLDYFAFKDIKITATETTDGTHSAYVYIEY